ncbi:MAG: hypothetical protein IJX92_02895 [Clostridia bacterium]|nr:hypothetical protein [Clostridia bacterium]
MSFIGHKLTDAELVSAVADGRFTSDDKSRRARALGLERILYVCRECGISRHITRADTLRCSICGCTAKILPSGELEYTEGAKFATLRKWYEYQKEFISTLTPDESGSTPIISDTVSFDDVTAKKKARILRKGTLSLFSDRLVIAAPNGETIDFSLKDTEDVCLSGACGINVYYGEGVYQFLGGRDFCALKYVNLFFRLKSIARGEERAEYLGVQE